MAGRKQGKGDANVATPKTKKPKKFKLGGDATLYVDPVANKKIANNEVVEFNDAEMSTQKFKTALRYGHLVAATDEDEGDQTPETNPELVAFLALPDDQTKKQFLKDTYENNAEEEIAIDAMNSDELLVAFKTAEGIED